MHKLFLYVCITFTIHPMEHLLSAIPAAMSGFVGYSAGRHQHLQETEELSQTYNKLLGEHNQLKSDLSKSGLLIRGIHQTVLCNPLNTFFNLSIEAGDENGMEAILRHRQNIFNINGLDENGATALHIAARKKNEYCIKYLCTLQANPNTPDIFGMTPMHYAAQANDTSMIACLITHGADPNIKRKEDGLSPLMAAIKANKREAMQFLLALKHQRAEIDRAPSPDHSVNLLGSLNFALEKQRALSASGHDSEDLRNSHDTLALIFHIFLQRNPECLICFDTIADQVRITKCCEKGICPACADKLLCKEECAFCRNPFSSESLLIYTKNSPPRSASPSPAASSSSSSVAASSRLC